MSMLLAVDGIGSARRRRASARVVAFVVYLVAAQADEKAIVRARCASSRATRSRTSATRSCSTRSSERAIAPVLERPHRPRPAVHARSATSTTSARSSSTPATPAADAVDRFLAIRVLTIAAHPGRR